MMWPLVLCTASAAEVGAGLHLAGLVLGPEHELTHPDNADTFVGHGVAMGAGVRASVALVRWLHVEGEVEAGGWPFRGGSAFVAGWRAGPRLVAHNVGLQGLHPHLTLGAGNLAVFGSSAQSGDDIDLALHVGPGLEIDLDRRLAMRADLRGLVTAKRGISPVPSVQGLFTLGLTYRLSRPATPEPAPEPEPEPEPIASLHLRVHDGHGHAIHDAEVRLDGRVVGETDADGLLVVDGLDPHDGRLEVTTEGAFEHARLVRLGAGSNPLEVDLDWRPGAVHVRATGPDGGPTDAHVVARSMVHGMRQWDLGTDGAGYQQLPPGTWAVAVSAEGAAPHRQDVRVSPERDSLLDLRLELDPAKVDVTADQIAIRESVKFTSSSHDVLEESMHVLQDVADVLVANPQFASVRIEGHTDAMGDDGLNLQLSQARADEVRRILITLGVEAVRLTAEGFGETRPIGDNGTPEGRAANRRVEFHVR